MTRVHLVRHAEHDLVGKRLAGRMAGVHLSAEGRAQAEALAMKFDGAEVGRLVCSPLERCRETAAPIAVHGGLAVDIDERFNELDCGEWTGQDFASLAEDPRWRAWNNERSTNGVPGGETIHAVQARVTAALSDFRAEQQAPVIVVSHSDVIKVAVLTLFGVDLERHDRLVIDPASITTVDLWPGGGKIVAMNERVS